MAITSVPWTNKKGIQGLDKVLRNLNDAVKQLSDIGVAKLLTVGLQVRAEGQRQTPVDTGNLINSWYGPTPFHTNNRVVVEIGLMASYAPYVHENVEAHFQKPGAKAKFLEDPLKMITLKDLEITFVKETKEKVWWNNQL